jgi:hypothetical protein
MPNHTKFCSECFFLESEHDPRPISNIEVGTRLKNGRRVFYSVEGWVHSTDIDDIHYGNKQSCPGCLLEKALDEEVARNAS